MCILSTAAINDGAFSSSLQRSRARRRDAFGIGCRYHHRHEDTRMCQRCLENPAQRSRSSRRAVLGFVAASTVGLALGSAGMAKDAQPPPKPQNALSPEASLERLLP